MHVSVYIFHVRTKIYNLYIPSVVVLQVLGCSCKLANFSLTVVRSHVDWSDSESTYTVRTHIKNGETTNSMYRLLSLSLMIRYFLRIVKVSFFQYCRSFLSESISFLLSDSSEYTRYLKLSSSSEITHCTFSISEIQ